MNDECGCDDLVSHLHQLLDAELEESECRRLQRHVDSCPACHEAADAEAHLRSLIRRSCAERAPDRLRIRVLAQITVLRTQGPAAGEARG